MRQSPARSRAENPPAIGDKWCEARLVSAIARPPTRWPCVSPVAAWRLHNRGRGLQAARGTGDGRAQAGRITRSTPVAGRVSARELAANPASRQRVASHAREWRGPSRDGENHARVICDCRDEVRLSHSAPLGAGGWPCVRP